MLLCCTPWIITATLASRTALTEMTTLEDIFTNVDFSLLLTQDVVNIVITLVQLLA